jgi:hypothetical protein
VPDPCACVVNEVILELLLAPSEPVIEIEDGAPDVLTLPVEPGLFVIVQFDGAYTPLNCALAGLKAALKPATAVTEITDKEIPRKKNMPFKKYTW